MNVEYFLVLVDKRMTDHPNERKGQAAFNLLCFDIGRDDLADLVRSTKYDPFFDNARMDDFIHFLVEKNFLFRQ